MRIGAFSLDALTGASGEDPDPSRGVAQAVRYYLANRDGRRPGWTVPNFLRGAKKGEVSELSVEIDQSAWEEFEEEAQRQRVSTDELLQHAVLYMVADRDSGRLTARILEDLEREEED